MKATISNNTQTTNENPKGGQRTTSVRGRPIDINSLSRWMLEQSEIQTLLQNKEENDTIDPTSFKIDVRQFGVGQSNPTYLLDLTAVSINDDSMTKQKLVLRRKPDKVAHKSAHAIHREVRVLKCLARHNDMCRCRHRRCHSARPQEEEVEQVSSSEVGEVPVPIVYCHCTDTSIIGSEFYIMEFVEGRIFVDPLMTEMMTTDERHLAYQDAIRVLSNIHAVRWREVGLEQHGSNGGSKFVKRQIGQLMKISAIQSKVAGKVEGLDEIARELDEKVDDCPGDDCVSLIHGDYKIDNLVFHPMLPKVIAVLDWELSSIGDPMCDVANLCMMYYLPGPEKGMAVVGFAGKDILHTGIPTRVELLSIYCSFNDSFTLATTLLWSYFYLAFLFFKNCVIIHGVAQRARLGVASSAIAEGVGKQLPMAVKVTREILREGQKTHHSRL